MLQSTGSRWLAGSGTSRAGAHRAAARLLSPPWACAQEGRGSESSRTHRDSAPGTAGRIRAGAGAGAEAPRRVAGGGRGALRRGRCGTTAAAAGGAGQGRRSGALRPAQHRAPAPHGQAPRKTWSWSALRAGAGAAGLPAGKGGPLPTQPAMETRASKARGLAPGRPLQDAGASAPPPGLSQMSVISFHTRPLFRQQPVL